MKWFQKLFIEHIKTLQSCDMSAPIRETSSKTVCILLQLVTNNLVVWPLLQTLKNEKKYLSKQKRWRKAWWSKPVVSISAWSDPYPKSHNKANLDEDWSEILEHCVCGDFVLPIVWFCKKQYNYFGSIEGGLRWALMWFLPYQRLRKKQRQRVRIKSWSAMSEVCDRAERL